MSRNKDGIHYTRSGHPYHKGDLRDANPSVQAKPADIARELARVLRADVLRDVKRQVKEYQRSGAQVIAKERSRQLDEEGWGPEHDDDNHQFGELARAAVCYAMLAAQQAQGLNSVFVGKLIPLIWPFERGWYKPKGVMRNLARAGALLAAEIDRQERRKKRPKVRPGWAGSGDKLVSKKKTKKKTKRR